MPFTVQDLIQENSSPITISPKASVQEALQKMLKHDFSQLPIVDEDDKLHGLITTDSILRALNHFKVTDLDQLKVKDALIKAKKFRNDTDLFELLDHMSDDSAVLIQDGEEKLIGIITSFNTTQYFRQRAQDFMLAEDIETMLKDYIQTAYQLLYGNEWDKKLKEASLKTLNHNNSGATPPRTPAEEPDEDVFNNKLTLFNYIQLFLHKDTWPQYESIFGLQKKALQTLLDKIRLIRNALAHFRNDLTIEHRETLLFCSEWLKRHQQEVQQLLSIKKVGVLSTSAEELVAEVPVLTISEPSVEVLQVPEELAEELAPTENRYVLLGLWLQSFQAHKDEVSLTFAEVEKIIRSKLPDSAYNHRSWWANDSVGHVQSKEWLAAGWRVSSVNMSAQTVKFAQIGDRQKSYINFFSTLKTKLLSSSLPFKPLDNQSPGGWNWHRVCDMACPTELAIGSLFVSFARNNQVRVEFYISDYATEVNKAIFDRMKLHQLAIETALGQRLSWERLDNKQASRIAVYLEGSIDNHQAHTQLQDEAIALLSKFYLALQEPLKDVCQNVNLKGNA